MNIVKKYLDNGQYHTTEHEKFSLFLHDTSSLSAMSAWRWWNSTPERVGTAYIIDRDGTPYEVFSPKAWAFHLGISHNNHHLHKHSIGIELVSAGKLYPEGKEFRFYPLWPNKQRYNVIPDEEVFTLGKEWRGLKHFHIYTESQLETLKWLIGRLALDFPSIEIENDVKKIFEYDKGVIMDNLPGIWSHCTVRTDKTDLFPYPSLIEALEEVQDEIMGYKKKPQIEEVKVVKKGKGKGKSEKKS